MTAPFLSVPIFYYPGATAGQLFTYVANSTTPQVTYSDAAGTVPNTNPVVLDTTGAAIVRLGIGLSYDFVLKDQTGTTTLWTANNYVQPLLSISTPQSAAELAASITPTNLAYLPGNPWRYGADGLGGANDIAALATASIVLAATGVNGWRNGVPNGTFLRQPAEIAASILPANYSYPLLDARRYGYSADNLTASAAANVTALNNAIAVAAATVAGATGATVSLPTGIAYINATINLPNRVRIKGQNCSGTIIRATTPFTTPTVPFMFYASNGTTSMFDSILEDMFVDANTVASLGCLKSIAWQENSGLRNVTFINFLTDGFRYENAWGGASTLELKQVQFFPPPQGANNCIFVNLLPVTAAGSFLLHLRDSVMAGSVQGGIITLGTLVGGAAYTNGNYVNVPLTGGAGQQATANITVAGGAVTVVTLVAFGSFVGGFGYLINDTLSAAAANIGGTGAGFTIKVATITVACTNGANIGGASLLLENVHVEGCLDGVYANTSGSITCINMTGISGMANLVHLDPAFTGQLTMIGCRRNGSLTNFLTNGVTGEVITSPDPSMYVYPDIRAPNTAKAWCMFNGTTAGTNAPTSGFNVTSVQKTGTGRYKITLSNQTNSANLATGASSNLTTSGAREWTQLVNSSSFNIGIDVAGTPTDASEVKCWAFGP